MFDSILLSLCFTLSFSFCVLLYASRFVFYYMLLVLHLILCFSFYAYSMLLLCFFIFHLILCYLPPARKLLHPCTHIFSAALPSYYREGSKSIRHRQYLMDRYLQYEEFLALVLTYEWTKVFVDEQK